MGGGGCGSGGSGFDPGATGAIKVALAILNADGHPDGTCFADGGAACSVASESIPLCVNSPEMPYVRGILSWVESNFCVDLDREFIGGVSSGAWESITLGCGDADQLRGFVSIAGGKREHRWPCTGPIAAFMIADSGDTANPVGPLAQLSTPSLDSYGSAPERDELLVRNGCQGSASAMYDPAYPLCVKYTGCPAAYPVVWCELNGGHTQTTEGGVDYARAIWPFLTSLPPSPK
jgi:poly(3-hydroxybutyrate) depolymerase